MEAYQENKCIMGTGQPDTINVDGETKKYKERDKDDDESDR